MLLITRIKNGTTKERVESILGFMLIAFKVKSLKKLQLTFNWMLINLPLYLRMVFQIATWKQCKGVIYSSQNSTLYFSQIYLSWKIHPLNWLFFSDFGKHINTSSSRSTLFTAAIMMVTVRSILQKIQNILFLSVPVKSKN